MIGGDLVPDVESFFQFWMRPLFEDLRSQEFVSSIPRVIIYDRSSSGI